MAGPPVGNETRYTSVARYYIINPVINAFAGFGAGVFLEYTGIGHNGTPLLIWGTLNGAVGGLECLVEKDAVQRKDLIPSFYLGAAVFYAAEGLGRSLVNYLR